MEYTRDKLDQAIASIKENLPSHIYKYRIFEEHNHQQILTDNIVWFSNPKNLNDPYDIRANLKIDLREVYTNEFSHLFREGLNSIIKHKPPHLDFESWFKQRLDLI